MTKDNYTGRYRLRLNSKFVPKRSFFKINYMSEYSNVTEQELLNLRKLAEQRKN